MDEDGKIRRGCWRNMKGVQRQMAGSQTENKEFDILCIGQADVDILLRPVDHLDFQTDAVHVDEIRLENGGDALNVAINMSRLNNKVAFAGLIGEDMFGQFLLEKMKFLGIDTGSVRRSRAFSTASAICLVSPSGERKFLYCGGANTQFTADDVDMNTLFASRVVFIGGGNELPRFDGDGAARILQTAQKRGKITAMDVTWCADGQWEKIVPSLKYLDFFMPSQNEARYITGCEEPEAMADALLRMGVKNVVIKMGGKGVLLKNSKLTYECAPVQVAVQDTTGAGDSFNSGFLTGLKYRWDLKKAVKFGCATSAFCIQRMGACPENINYEKVCAVAFSAV